MKVGESEGKTGGKEINAMGLALRSPNDRAFSPFFVVLSIATVSVGAKVVRTLFLCPFLPLFYSLSFSSSWLFISCARILTGATECEQASHETRSRRGDNFRLMAM